ncbi:MAG: ParA family protein [Bdellovibrionota bacterium]
MKSKNTKIVAIINQKGGVGKTTTAINLAQALALQNMNILVVDLDPQGNATQGLGISLEDVTNSIAELIRDNSIPTESAVYEGTGLNLIPATPLLASVQREMVGITNSELRLAARLAKLQEYDMIFVDTPPTFGPLMNSALNAADELIVPVDSNYFGLMGIKNLLSEIEAVQLSNPKLKVSGYLMTLVDQTKVTLETLEALESAFGDKIFRSKIRRCVKLREAPALGRTIFHHAPSSIAAEDYLSLAAEVLERSGVLIQQ